MSEGARCIESLERPTVVIFGSESRLGKLLAHKLESNGSIVVLVDIKPNTFDLANAESRFMHVDVTSADSLAELLSKLIGSVGGYVYLPRIRRRTAWGSTTMEDLIADFSVTAGGFILFAQALTNALRQNPSCLPTSVVAFSSALARFVSPAEGISYHLAKAALEHAVRYASVELGSLGVRVNAISPGWVSRAVGVENQFPEKVLSAVEVGQALPDMANEYDLVSLTLFLLALPSQGITGQVLNLDGGLGLREPVSAMIEAAARMSIRRSPTVS